MLATSVPDLPAYISLLLSGPSPGGGELQFPVLGGRESTTWGVDAKLERNQLTTDSLMALYESLLKNRLGVGGPEITPPMSRTGSTVCVLEDDSSAVLGATLAAYSGRQLYVLSEERLARPVEWAQGQRVTLLASAPKVTFQVLDALSELSVPLKVDQPLTLFSIMTAASPIGLSRLVHRSLSRLCQSASTTALAVIEHQDLARSPLPPMSGCTTLINPSTESVRQAMLGPDSHHGTVSFYGHGREYCTRLGQSALCAQGDEGQSEGTCINGMTCFNSEWLRISPRRVSAHLVFINSCSVVKPAQTIYDYARNLGLDFLEGTASGVIASYLVADCTPVENYLFHALAAAGYSLSEMVWILNHASGPSRRLIALGDGELILGYRDQHQDDWATTPVTGEAGQWRIMLSEAGKDWNGQLLSLDSAELRRSALNHDLVVFGEGPGHSSMDSHGHPVSSVFPGLMPSHTLLYVAAQHESQLDSLRLFDRSHPHLRSLSDLIEQAMRRHAQLRAYARFDEYPLRRLEEQVGALYDLYQSLVSPRRRRIVPLERLEDCRELVRELERSANAALVERVGRTHCGEIFRLDRLRERDNYSGEPCPYCGSAVTTTINDGNGWIPFTLITSICPLCGIISYRMTEHVELTVLCQDQIARDSSSSFRVGVKLRNGSGLPLLARLTMVLFPLGARCTGFRTVAV